MADNDTSEAHRALDREIDGIIKEWTQAQDAGPKVPIFHYTSVSAAVAVLTRGHIWASDARFLNDFGELRYAWRRVIEVSEARARDSLPWQWVHGLVSHRELWTFDGLRAYVASFSEEPDLLSQWRAYAADGCGYSLGIEPMPIPDHRDILGGAVGGVGGPVRLRVIYDEAEQAAGIASIAAIAEAAINSVRQQGAAEDDARRLFMAGAARLLAFFVVMFKHAGFAEEKEWRLVWILDDTARRLLFEREVLKFRDTPYGACSYLDWPLVSDRKALGQVVKAVCLGPRVDTAAGKDALEELCRLNGLDQVQLLHSATTYR